MSYLANKANEFCSTTFKFMQDTTASTLRAGLLQTYKPALMLNHSKIKQIMNSINNKFHILEVGMMQEQETKHKCTITWEEIYGYMLKKQKKNAKKGIFYTPEDLESFRADILERLFNNDIYECFKYLHDNIIFESTDTKTVI